MTDRDTITLPREVVKLALEAFEAVMPFSTTQRELKIRAVEALRTHLAAEQPKQEPVALADRLDDERMNLIERLADENERLREALAWIAKRCLMHLEVALDAGACARAALRREET